MWTLGYELDHAWFLAAADGPPTHSTFERALVAIDDDRLIAQLEATAAERGDGSLPFASSLWLRSRD